MKLLVAVAVLTAGTRASTRGDGQGPKNSVRVCLSLGGNATTIVRGEAAATQILRQAGIRLEWRMIESDCTAGGNGIVVTVSNVTPRDLHGGALAYALPYERTHIVLFYDRVLNTVGPNSVPALLGHVLAHEIVHILQGVAVHSATGIMKERWDSQDYAEMQRGRLKFTRDDIDLIGQGTKSRAGYHK